MSGNRHLLTIDLEEHFQLVTTGRGVPERHWDRFPARIPRNAARVLRLLDRHRAKATFFTGSWVTERHRALIAEIAGEGHEIACHFAWGRRPVGPGAADIAEHAGESKRLLEAAAGRVVHGCRVARAQRSGPRTHDPGALGFRYECSLGSAAARFRAPPDSSAEAAPVRVGVPSLRVAGQDVALAGGECLRQVPGALLGRYLAGCTAPRAPRVFTFKLWEIDPELAELAILSRAQRLLSYRNHAIFGDRLERLLDCAEFVPVREHLRLAEERAMRSEPAAPAATPRAEVAARGVPVSIVVPCFNEEAGLAYLANVFASLDAGLGRRHRLSFVLVDDGSTDGTWPEMQRLFGDDARFRLVRHDRNRGVAAAILTGIGAAEDDTVATIDSDCSYDPARIEEMLALLAPDVALVTASPYHAGAGVEGVPGWRLFVSRGASWLYRQVLRNKLATYTSCFRIHQKSALDGLILRHEGFIGVAEMLARLDMAGWRIAEHPVVLETRLLGRSKLRLLRAIAGHLHLLGEIAIARLLDRRCVGAMAVTRGGR